MSLFKKPKLEIDTDDNVNTNHDNVKYTVDDDREQEDAANSLDEQEEALIALIEHRDREVENLRRRISHYTFQLQQAEKLLNESKGQLARLRQQSKAVPSRTSVESRAKTVKLEQESHSPVASNSGTELPSRSQSYARTELLIPSTNPKPSQPLKPIVKGVKVPTVPTAQSTSYTKSNNSREVKVQLPSKTPAGVEVAEIPDRRSKRKIEQKEHKDLVSLVSRNSSPCTIHCYTSNHIPSQHKRKMRSLVLCPVNEQLFATSALDGMVKLWELKSRGPSASLLSTNDCASLKDRHWPEDLAWHPLGNSLFSTYTADGGDPQISVLDLNKAQGSSRVTFLEDKPHKKGKIHSIAFMPWDNPCFGTGGGDHAVVLWNKKDSENLWKSKVLHRNLHSSAVMGVAGLRQKEVVLSAGADKRIIGFDVQAGRADFKHQLDSKCMSVLPNPCDMNLFMAQIATPQKQLRLFDVRLRQLEIHSIGFKQESSDSQSALINQAWSPDGLYITSGSVDPVIHIFDIRYNSDKPSQSIRAHQRRVFKAVWNQSAPLLISISSDLQIGLHKIT